MSYRSEISRDNPTCFLFVIDQSGSMDEKMSGGRTKAQFVADVLNKTIQTTVTNCSKADGIRNYFDIGIISYGGEGVAVGLGHTPVHATMGIAELGNSPLRVEARQKKVDDGAGGVLDVSIKFPVWFDPQSSGGTPMCAAMTKSAEILVGWCDDHPNSYPPTILHVTDGESTDGNPEEIAGYLRQISTNDGPCLLFNLHVSSSGGTEIIFPTPESELPDPYSQMLFRMSSPFPAHIAAFAREKGYDVFGEARGFIYNAGPEFVVDFFDIGTRPRLSAGAR
jgi:hypothetical protein